MPAKKPLKPSSKKSAKPAASKPSKASARKMLGHPNDPALSRLMAGQAQMQADIDRAISRLNTAHPNDPALSTLLARLEQMEHRLDQLVALLEKGVAPKAATPKAAPNPGPVSTGPGALTAPADGDTAHFLARTPLFAKLSAQECSVLAQYLEAKSLAAGTVLFQQGDFGDAMYVVKAGALEIYKNDVFGAVRVAEVRPGGLVGEMALVENKPRSANVRASDEARLLMLSRGAYAQLKQAHPQVATKFQDELLLLLSGRLRQTTEKLVGKTA